jgi:hypothetical protein
MARICSLSKPIGNRPRLDPILGISARLLAGYAAVYVDVCVCVCVCVYIYIYVYMYRLRRRLDLVQERRSVLFPDREVRRKGRHQCLSLR